MKNIGEKKLQLITKSIDTFVLLFGRKGRLVSLILISVSI